MCRHLLVSFFACVVVLCSQAAWAVESLPRNYYPYKPRYADVYLGLSYASTADVSTNSAGNPQWGALYNPMKLLGSYGFNFDVGIRPLEVIPLLRNFRIEGELLYRESRYDILIDGANNSWIDKSKLPKVGKIHLKNVAMFNLYYDLRLLSNIFYPYVGAGIGTGDLGIRHLDFTMLPSYIGEQYMGHKKHVLVTQFLGGLQYDTKIIKTSVFLEYRYTQSGTARAYPTFTGNEHKSDKDEDGSNSGNNNPPSQPEGDFTPPQDRNISYKAHAIVFGLKYYLY